MAQKEEVAESASSGGLLGAIVGGVSKMWSALTDDGYLAAAGRQGMGELGMALKAFPDSIQVQEPGTIFNPTQGEIAADRRDDSRSPWPSEIAAQNRNKPDTGQGYDNGRDTGYSM